MNSEVNLSSLKEKEIFFVLNKVTSELSSDILHSEATLMNEIVVIGFFCFNPSGWIFLRQFIFLKLVFSSKGWIVICLFKAISHFVRMVHIWKSPAWAFVEDLKLLFPQFWEWKFWLLCINSVEGCQAHSLIWKGQFGKKTIEISPLNK